MLRKLLRVVSKSPSHTLILIGIFGIALFNVLAYNHAYAMLHFSQHGERTVKPETLSWGQKIKTLLMGVNIPKPINDSTPDDLGLAYETHYFKVDDDIELEAWYMPHPQSKGTVLMFHGYAVSKSSLLPEALAFNEMGYTTLLVDFRGSGGSNQSETSIGFFEANDVVAAVEYAQLRWPDNDLILYGQSMGGVAILRAIAEHEVKPDRIIVEAVFDRMLSTVENRFTSMGIPSFPGAQILVFWGGFINGHSGFRHNPVEYASKVLCPVLMLHGTYDERATLQQAQAVFEEVNGEKYFESFMDIGHESYLSVNPDQWKNIVEQFLAR